MKEENLSSSSNSKKNLVFGLNLNGEIIQFDIECQRLTGYLRKDVLNKKIDEILIPKSYVNQWRTNFNSVKKNINIDNFEIPWLTSDGFEFLISLNSEIIKDKEGNIKHIFFIGKYKGDMQIRPSHIIKNQIVKDEKKTSNYDDIKLKENKKTNNKNLNNYDNGNDKIISIKDEKKISPCLKNNIVFERDGKKIYFEANPSLESDNKSNFQKEKNSYEIIKSNEFIHEPDKVNKKIVEIIKKYENLNNKLKELEKKDRKLERKNKLLEKNLKNLNTNLKKRNIIETDKNYCSDMNLNRLSKNSYRNKFFNPFRFKKRNKEFEIKKDELEQREKELDRLWDQLINERKIHDKRIAEFVIWKEKLFLLESEIEKRRKEIMEQEELLKADIYRSESKDMNFFNVISDKEDSLLSNNSEIGQDYHNLIDKIPQSAAIIQRSIVKQVNSSFAELIGFETDEIVDKSLFDFIAAEGLGEIEKYYLNRLKGNDNSKYITILLTKDDSKIQVEVNIKPTIYNGEKAEIAVITELEGFKLNKKDYDLETVDQKDLKSQNEIYSEGVENSVNKSEFDLEPDSNIKDKNYEIVVENKKIDDDSDDVIVQEDIILDQKINNKKVTNEKSDEEISE